MKPQAKTRDRWWGDAAGALLAVAAGVGLHLFPFGRTLKDWSYDSFFIFRAHRSPGDAVMVYMDDDSHAKLEQPFNAPWDRRLHAKLLDRLTAAGARAVVFDIVFSDASDDPAKDQVFAEAIARNGRVVLAADTVPAGYGVEQVAMRMVTPPTELLMGKAAQVGSAELLPSHDIVVRRHFHGSPDDLLTSLSWATAELVGAPVARQKEDRFRQRYLNYYGPPGILPSVSYHLALDASATPDALFRDKVVFIGARLFTVFAGQRKDEFRTPYSAWNDRNQFMPGVEVQASLLLNLLRGDSLHRWGANTELCWLVVLGAGLGFWLARLRPWRASLSALLWVILIGTLAHWVCSQTGYWFPWLLVVVQVGVALVWALSQHYMRLYVEHRVLEQSLAAHLSPQRVKQLLKRPELLRPGAEKQELTILFSDIANFTKISEGMDSDDLARLMNDYFETAISRCIHYAEGYVVKYIGDAIFAIWNAPLPQADHRERACQAALRLRNEVVQFQGHESGLVLRTRIGLHTGVANVGNFGSLTRVDYTALGENVNLASRMEGLNKHLGTHVLATRQTQIAVADRMLTRQLGHFRLKGFEKAIEVHELIGPLELEELTRPWRESFARGLRHFQEKNFTAARADFERTLELNPDDGPSYFYIAEMMDLLPELMPPDWAGEVLVREK